MRREGELRTWSRCSLPSDSSLVAFSSLRPPARTAYRARFSSAQAPYIFCTSSARAPAFPPCCGYPWSSHSSPSCTFPQPSTSTSTRARTDASSRNCPRTPSSSVSPFAAALQLSARPRGRVETTRTELTPGNSSIGHYKAEEWQESTKNYIVNDQLGIQIVVQVRFARSGALRLTHA